MLKTTDWTELIKRLDDGNNIALPSNLNVPGYTVSLSKDGKKLDYVGNTGRKIVEWTKEKGGNWTVYEREGSRWEPTTTDTEAQNILDHYKINLETILSLSPR